MRTSVYLNFFLITLYINSYQQELSCHFADFQYPSYIDRNHYGLCLRALKDLNGGTIIASAMFEPTAKPYISNHRSQNYRHVAIRGLAGNGKPIYARVRGKWAFCNHSCEPNCIINEYFQIITNRAVKKGEELTIAYDAYIPNLPWQETWNFNCLCGSPRCKRIINKYRTDILSPIFLQNGIHKR